MDDKETKPKRKDPRKYKHYPLSHPSNNHLHPVRLRAKEKRAKAWMLRLKKVTYKKIAEEVGYGSVTAVRHAIKQYIETEIEQETAEEARMVIAGQNDEIAKIIMEAAKTGDLKACEVLLKYQDQRAKLLGAYSPVKTESKTENFEIKVNNINISKMTDSGVEEIQSVIEIKAEDSE